MAQLTNDELKKIYFGAYSFKETDDGYLQAFQYTDDRVEYFKAAFDFWYDRCLATTAKTLEFTTEATNITFDYKFVWRGSEDSVEAWVNGLAHQIQYVKDMEDEGTVSFDLPNGPKNVIIYLPSDATLLIRNVQINGEYSPAVKNTKVLWLGDSITQGYGPLRSAHTYVSVANRLLNYDIINQGIGGYVYDVNALEPMPGYRPDKIIVALGTNQYGDQSMDGIVKYYDRLTTLYSGIPILAITPIWRGDSEEGMPTFLSFCEKLKEIISRYPAVQMIDGFELVPHLPEYYIDNLHPNVIGAEMYGRNLVERIRELGF